MNYIICHYAEIGLKGKNRKFFEEQLKQNIQKALGGLAPGGQAPFGASPHHRVKRISGALLIELKQTIDKEKIRTLRFAQEPCLRQIGDCLKNVFGLAYFAFAEDCQQDIEVIKRKAVDILKSQNFDSFRIQAKRSNKNFKLSSQQINKQVGAYVLENLESQPKPQVVLKNPEITLFIEIVDKYALFYLEKIPGLGGLPVGVSEKAMALLSGGIDSPVASFYGMKRGTKISFVHFTSYPFTKKTSVEKVKKIVKVLNKFQFGSNLYLVPFTDIQKAILLKTKARLRVLLYRRFMFKIAEALAQKEKAKALITGESVGQVASQTLSNIAVVEEAVNMPIFRPLISYDKEDIIQKAKEIGSFEISILPGQDCCSMFLPQHPETKANLKEVKAEEKKLAVDNLIKQAIEKCQLQKIQLWPRSWSRKTQKRF